MPLRNEPFSQATSELSHCGSILLRGARGVRVGGIGPGRVRFERGVSATRLLALYLPLTIVSPFTWIHFVCEEIEERSHSVRA